MKKSITDFFKQMNSNKNLTDFTDFTDVDHPLSNFDTQSSVEDLKPRYPKKELMPPVLQEGEYETIEEEIKRFKQLHPITVLYEVAERLQGKLTRLDPEVLKSTPIVLKSTGMGMCTIVFYKNNSQFTIYETLTFETYCGSKNMITNRKSIYGLQKAFEDIEKGYYDKVFNKK